MASKKFKGKTCVYCSKAISETADHVFAREFLLETRRQNTPKVPACRKCNNEKSGLEHYLTTVLPFGGRHPDARENLEIMVHKRLEKTQTKLSLHRERDWIRTENSLYVRPLTMPIDGDKIERFFCFIAKGLIFHHWRILLDDTYSVLAIHLMVHGEAVFDRYFGMRTASRVNGNIGNGNLIYEGVQGINNPQITVWRFQIYGGVILAEHAGCSNTSKVLGAVTAKTDTIEQIKSELSK